MYVGDVKKPAPGTIRADVEDAGLSWSTVRRAADDLGVISERCSFTGKYQWRLPKLVAEADEGPHDLSNLSNLSNHKIPEANGEVLPVEPAGCSGSHVLSNHATDDEPSVSVPPPGRPVPYKLEVTGRETRVEVLTAQKGSTTQLQSKA